MVPHCWHQPLFAVTWKIMAHHGHVHYTCPTSGFGSARTMEQDSADRRGFSYPQAEASCSANALSACLGCAQPQEPRAARPECNQGHMAARPSCGATLAQSDQQQAARWLRCVPPGPVRNRGKQTAHLRCKMLWPACKRGRGGLRCLAPIIAHSRNQRLGQA